MRKTLPRVMSFTLFCQSKLVEGNKEFSDVYPKYSINILWNSGLGFSPSGPLSEFQSRQGVTIAVMAFSLH
jgi:hypothetical protein